MTPIKLHLFVRLFLTDSSMVESIGSAFTGMAFNNISGFMKARAGGGGLPMPWCKQGSLKPPWPGQSGKSSMFVYGFYSVSLASCCGER